MDSAEYETRPAGDSRPIRFEALLEHEQELIRRVNSLLQGIQKNVKRPPNPGDPWAAVDDNRQHRVLMISGPRGSGKTSLMLTLLAGWRAAWTGDWEAIAAPQYRTEAEDLFTPMASVVRPLKPLDFDPLPPDLPLYGWIVQAFRPLVQWLMNDGRSVRDGRSARDMGYSTQDRASVPWSGNQKSIQEQLQDLYQTAIVGWGVGKLREAFQKDLYDLVLDQEQQHLNWQQLQANWQRFLDNIFKDLDRTDEFPKNGLLVLPIDDADLQIERDRELILAIRLLYHPRLVYLLTGDKKNLEENLTLENLKRMLVLDSFPDATSFDEKKIRAKVLSHALVQKVLPPSYVFAMERLTFRQALEWDGKTLGNLLAKIPLELDRNFTLQQFLEKRHLSLDFPCLLFRDLQRLQDQYMKKSSSTECLVDFLEALRNEEDEDEFSVGRGEERQIVLHTYSGIIVPVARVHHFARIQGTRIEVRVGEKLEFNQERIAGDLSRANMPVQASPLTLLALDLAAEVRRVYVRQHTPRIRPPQCLAWSIWHSDSYETWFSWPSIVANSPTQLARRAEQWSEAIRNLDTYDLDEWVDRVAFAWISLHLLWLEEKEDQDPTALGSKTDMQNVWSELGKTLKVVKPGTRSLPWFEMELPLLTAPEYGLSKNMRIVLLEALLGTDAPQRLPQKWQDARRKAAGDAKKFKRGQTYEDLFEVFTDYQDNDGSPEERVKALLDEIAGEFSDSPWTKSRRARNSAVKRRL